MQDGEVKRGKTAEELAKEANNKHKLSRKVLNLLFRQ